VVSPEEIWALREKSLTTSFMQFPKVNPKQSFPELEEAVLAYWEKEKIFEATVKRKATKGEFVFYDGPPFATGLPHYGHILQGVIKDFIPRYKTMQGYKVPRKWGWDCHGLPVENLIEKELGLKNREEIEKYGIGKFNEKCRDSVLRYANEWKKTVKRMGRWIDMENDYKTMDVDFMDSVWWVFHELWEKGLIYEGLKPMHICPRCETPLSNFEVGLGYKDTTDVTAIAKFELEDEKNTFVLAWTTTPWTLPGNVALAVNPSLTYVKAKMKSQTIICSEAFWGEYEKQLEDELKKAGGSKQLGERETPDRKSTRLNSSHRLTSRMPSSA
jgi:isoleucyl-tRNA synthetase